MKKLQNYTIILIFAVVFTTILPNLVFATVDTVGGTGDTSGLQNSNEYGTYIIASANGNLQSVSMNLNAGSGNAIMGIYSDSLGFPSTLLASSSVQSLTTGWNDFSVTGVSIVSGTKYWIVISTQSSSPSVKEYDDYPTAVGYSYYTSHNYDGTLLGTWGTSYAWTGIADPVTINVRMTYTASPQFLYTYLTSPTNTTYSTEPNITFLLNSSATSGTCNWVLNSYLTKTNNVTVQNITSYSDFITGGVGGLNGTNSLSVNCANTTLVNSSSVTFTVNLGTGTSTSTNLGLKIRFPEGDTIVRAYVS
jgi:hypothetical protein